MTTQEMAFGIVGIVCMTIMVCFKLWTDRRDR